MKRILALAVFVVVGLLMAPAAWAATTHAATLQGFQFLPNPLNIAVGDTVTWTNLDGAAHNVTNDAPGTLDPFASPDLSSPQTYTRTFNTPGSYTLRCTLHEGMTGILNVSAVPDPVVPEVPYSALLAATGGAMLVGALVWQRRMSVG